MNPLTIMEDIAMTEIRTCEKLLRALKESSSREPSFDRLDKQRISFVMGSLPDRNSMSRDDVQIVLERQEGRKLAAG